MKPAGSINAALEFQRRKRAELKASQEAAKPAHDSEPAALADPEPPKPTGIATLDHQNRVRHEEAKARIAEARKQRQETALQEVRSEQSEFDQQLADLKADIARYREIPRGEARDALITNEILPKWEPVVVEYMDSGKAYPNPIAVYVLIWEFNTGKWLEALTLADLLIKQQQRTPDTWKRDLPTFVADAAREIAEDLHAREQDIPEELQERGQGFAADPKLPNDVRIKWHKLLGDIHAEDDPAYALACYQHANDIDPKIAKVKTRINKIQRQLKT